MRAGDTDRAAHNRQLTSELAEQIADPGDREQLASDLATCDSWGPITLR